MTENAIPSVTANGPWSIDDLRAACDRGFSKTLGVEVVSASAKHLTMRMAIDDRHANSVGMVHGGVLTAFADACAGMATMHNLPTNARTATTDSQTQFLRPATGPVLHATATLTRMGRSRAVWTVQVGNSSGKIVSVTTQAQTILTSEGA